MGASAHLEEAGGIGADTRSIAAFFMSHLWKIFHKFYTPQTYSAKFCGIAKRHLRIRHTLTTHSTSYARQDTRPDRRAANSPARRCLWAVRGRLRSGRVDCGRFGSVRSVRMAEARFRQEPGREEVEVELSARRARETVTGHRCCLVSGVERLLSGLVPPPPGILRIISQRW